MFQSSFSVVARREHPLVKQAGLKTGAAMPLDMFCSLAQIRFSSEGRFNAELDEELEKQGLKRNVVMTLPVLSGMCKVVARSDCIAVVPRQIGELYAQLAPLTCLRLPIAVEPSRLVMLWRRRSTHDMAHAWFRSVVAGILAPLNIGEDLADK